jgi:vacuolar-type H+-ATPase subunit H
MTVDPLEEILSTERSVADAIKTATEEVAVARTAARRRAEQLVEDAAARGKAIADRRYEEGLARARDEGDRIRATADERVARLRRQADAELAAAVELVMRTVLPASEEP